MMGYNGDMMWGGFVWGLLGLVLLAVLVGAVAYLILDGRRDRGSASPTADEAWEVLRRRYAAGEIDEDEYTRRLSFISRN